MRNRSKTNTHTPHVHVIVHYYQESELKVLQGSIKEGVSIDAGPQVRALEKALKCFNVERQAYWSASFIGNHVHPTLKV